MSEIRIIEDIVYQENMGAAGLLDLYLPEGNASGTLLIYFHGGGLEGGDKKDDSGVYKELAASGTAVVSANYRMYPLAKYPEYIEDAARSVAWSLAHVKEYASYEHVYIGGISAGAYLSMMLHFQPKFLAECGVDEREIAGYIFDEGQPTVHFNVLRERGMNPKAVRVDEAAPIYYLTDEQDVNDSRRFLVLVAEHDIEGRREQNELLISTMRAFGYAKERISYHILKGCEHAQYLYQTDEAGRHPYVGMLCDFMG